MNEIIDRYREGFAIEINNVEFNKHRAQISQELSIMLLRLISDLNARKEYIDSKKYLAFLKQIDKSDDYKNLTEEIISNIS
jgi:hypothetical protein